MPLTAKGPLKRSTRRLWTVLAIVLPIGLGAVIFYAQAERALVRSSLETLIVSVGGAFMVSGIAIALAIYGLVFGQF